LGWFLTLRVMKNLPTQPNPNSEPSTAVRKDDDDKLRERTLELPPEVREMLRRQREAMGFT